MQAAVSPTDPSDRSQPRQVTRFCAWFSAELQAQSLSRNRPTAVGRAVEFRQRVLRP